MEVYYTVVLFLFGIVLGSFYNVVGYRLPKGESIVKPPSHCPNCGHRLGPSELIPVFSYLFLGGKCKNCKQKISLFYPLFELATGLLFALSYLLFGFSIELAIALTFVSALLIIIISDYQTMIIPDEVLLVAITLILILIGIKDGFSGVGTAFFNGLIAFGIMFLLKKIGDFLFKQESMGGGDIKLMFLFGLVLGYQMTIIAIFIASFIGLPISLIILYKKKDHIIPFGPFLAVGAMILFFLQLDFHTLISYLTHTI